MSFIFTFKIELKIMKVTTHNIKDLSIGEFIYIVPETSPIIKAKYLGVFDITSDKENTIACEYFVFADLPYGKVYSKHILCSYSKEEDLKFNHYMEIFTTYQEACEQQRELVCNLISHWNQHQFENNPIKFK